MGETNNHSHNWKYSNKQLTVNTNDLILESKKYSNSDIEEILEKSNYKNIFYSSSNGLQAYEYIGSDTKQYPFIILIYAHKPIIIKCASFPDFISCLNEVSIISKINAYEGN